MNSKNLKGLCEAYGGIYAPQELTEDQVWEEVEIWVNALIEEGYDLSDYTWEEMFEAYISEQGQSGSSPRASAGVSQDSFSRAIRGDGPARNQPKPGSNIRGGGQFRPKMGSLPSSARQVTQYPQGVSTGVGGGNSGASRSDTPAKPATTPEKPATTPEKPATTPAKPSAGAPRPAATAPASPKVAPTKPAGSAMDQFAKANPKLAASAAERARTRGTSATTNPLMRDMKSRMPAPSTPSPTTTSTAFSKSTPSLSKPMSSSSNYSSAKVSPSANVIGKKDQKSLVSSYEWGSTSKLVDDIANLYQSVYEAKKVDQDKDGDNDFADVRIARLIASGVSKEEAIRRVRDKSYNEGYVPWDFGPKDKAKAKHTELAARKEAGGSAPGTATRANRIASVAKDMRTTLDKNSAATGTNPARQGLQPATQRHTAAALRGAGGGMTASKVYDVKPLKPASKGKGPKGGGSSAQGVGSPSGTGRYQVGGGQGYGISGIKLADEFELWVNELVEEGYDLSDYTWDEMIEIYEETELGEATRMRRELGKEGEIATRKELASRSKAYQRSGSVDRTIAAAERGAKNPYVAMGKNETEADYSKRKQEKSKTLTRLASNRRGSVRDKPRAGLRGYAAKVEGGDRDLQSARSSARSAGTLTPAEKKGLGEEFDLWVNALIYEGYDLSEYTWDEMIEIYEETANEKEDRIAARRARIKEMEAQGRVMTSSKRASQKAAQRKQEKKEEMADRLLRSIQASGSTRSSSTPMGTKEPEEKPEAPAANRKLGGKVKKDDLASQANAILRTIKNENIQLWVNELINEGYDLTGWTSKEITKLYFEIFE
jgi:hypothetical protein